MLQSIERFLKQAIVDKSHAVSSAALVSSLVRASSHMIRFLVKSFTMRCSCSTWLAPALTLSSVG